MSAMREAYRPMKLSAENDNIVHTADDARVTEIENRKAVAIAEELLRWYPGHPWHVRCKLWANVDRTIPGGVLISLPAIMPPNKGYNIPLAHLTTAAEFTARIRNAGGEILERYKLPRSGCSFDHLLAARPKRTLSYKDKVPA